MGFGKKLKNKETKMQRFIGEFKAFAMKGSMIDMAVGIIVGAAFSAVTNSLVANIATPLIGVLIGVDFESWEIALPRLYGSLGPSTVKAGTFLNNLISFVIISFTVFLFIKVINKLRKKQEETPPPPPKPTREEELLTEIRDLLLEKKKREETL